MPRKPEYKPLLYTTTIRNPERFKDFMHILKRFNGRILNNKTVELFERELFKVGLYRPMKRPETVQDKWKSTKNGELASKPLTDEETKDVYQQNDPQVNKSIKGHKEAGFPKGYYGFSSKVRIHIYMGQRLTYDIDPQRRFLAKSVTFFYEISTCDLYLVSAVQNSYLRPRDYLSLSFGLKFQWL